MRANIFQQTAYHQIFAVMLSLDTEAISAEVTSHENKYILEDGKGEDDKSNFELHPEVEIYKVLYGLQTAPRDVEGPLEVQLGKELEVTSEKEEVDGTDVEKQEELRVDMGEKEEEMEAEKEENVDSNKKGNEARRKEAFTEENVMDLVEGLSLILAKEQKEEVGTYGMNCCLLWHHVCHCLNK